MARHFHVEPAPLTDETSVSRTQQSYWVFFYHDFLLQGDPIKLKTRLGPRDASLFERLKELDEGLDSHAEKVAIREACRKLLHFKIEKLGFTLVIARSA